MSDGIAPETGIPRLWDSAVLVSRRTDGSEEPVSVSGCYTSTLNSIEARGARVWVEVRDRSE